MRLPHSAAARRAGDEDASYGGVAEELPLSEADRAGADGGSSNRFISLNMVPQLRIRGAPPAENHRARIADETRGVTLVGRIDNDLTLKCARVYTTKRWVRLAGDLLALIIVTLAVLIVYRSTNDQRMLAALLEAGSGVVMAAAGVILRIAQGRARVALRGDVLELTLGLSSKRMIDRRHLLGFRLTMVPAPFVILMPRDIDRKALKIPMTFNFDSDFERWLDVVPNLDETHK